MNDELNIAMNEGDKRMISDEIIALEKLYLLNAFKNKHKIFKKYKIAKSTFLISKN